VGFVIGEPIEDVLCVMSITFLQRDIAFDHFGLEEKKEREKQEIQEYELSRRMSYPVAIGLGRVLTPLTLRRFWTLVGPAAKHFLPPPLATGATSSTWSSVSAEVGFSGNVNASGTGLNTSISLSSSSVHLLNGSWARVLPGVGPEPAWGIGILSSVAGSSLSESSRSLPHVLERSGPSSFFWWGNL